MFELLRFVPKSHLSHAAGWLMHKQLPGPLARWSVRAFASKFGIDVAASARPLESYRSIGEFFTRDLKPGLRPIESDFVSPCDALLRNFGTVQYGRIEQVKGRDYSLSQFLGGDGIADSFDGGSFFNFYLSPRDYHHVHAPVTGDVVRSVVIPGWLWPVNDWSIANVDGLFAVNERVVTYLRSRFGLVAVVMIGATNVGRMTVTYDSFVTNSRPRLRELRWMDYGSPTTLRAGDRLGTFHMGSSVVVLARKGIIASDRIAVRAPSPMLYGRRLLND
ncbi:MAG: phosphatidylserine decarboxylase [Acidobacteria bacterium]|nr:phosphatidylserine decarboxylase [Acidobacteriota bacterium]